MKCDASVSRVTYKTTIAYRPFINVFTRQYKEVRHYYRPIV